MGLKEYPLSVQQTHLWALQGLSQAYYTQCAICLDGVLDVAALLNALKDHHLRSPLFLIPSYDKKCICGFYAAVTD